VAGALAAFEALLPDQVRVLGADHTNAKTETMQGAESHRHKSASRKSERHRQDSNLRPTA
jgi:hypothetical protein